MKKYYRVYLLLLLLSVPSVILAQTATDTTITNLTLQQCIDFALRNQPGVRQANIDEEINEKDINISLSAWLPQVNSTGAFSHYFQRFNAFGAQTGTGTGTGTSTGAAVPGQQLAIATNVSNLGLSASQALYNNEVMQASKASKFSRQYYKQNSVSAKIDVVSNVSKAFYDLLLSQRQLDIINQDIARLQRNLRDASSRYQAGVVDKIDSKQATIGLNNSLASRKQLQEAVNSRTAYLKQLMGYTPQRPLTASYDSVQLVRSLVIDTNQVLNVNNRIEYTMLETQKNLNNVNVSYYKYGFLPSVSAVGSYNLQYFSSSVSNLYKDAFPTSLVGLNISIPIFQGTKRLQNLSKARLQVKRTDLDLENSRNAINTEYTQALASYKSNFTNYKALGENVELAKDVYNVVSLQYREGIKTYLDLIVAQTDLRTASLNYYNALFQLLSSKVDLQRALGTLPVQ